MASASHKSGFVVFALLIISAPLMFGATDRLPQLLLVAFFALGIFICPPSLGLKNSRAKIWWLALLTFLGILILKEFLPANWFGLPVWRKELAGEYGVSFPWTHNPEPGRAVDGICMVIVGVIWFLWVRTLAADPKLQVGLYWTLFLSAVVVAGVSIATQADPGGNPTIYGVRYTPGWTGYGPFPNRNHTASYLALGALLGIGCIGRAARRKNYFVTGIALLLLGAVIVALLASKSRGGLVAFGFGLMLFCAMLLVKYRSIKALSIVSTVVLCAMTLVLIFGGPVLSRFGKAQEGEISSNVRLDIWKDTLGMAGDAPLFGHGIGTFSSVYPFYQNIKLANQAVFHPESSWLRWLAEGGVLLFVLGLALAAVWFFVHLRKAYEMKRGFYFAAAGYAAVFALILHSWWDVPAHKWAIMGYALAILAILAPFSPAQVQKQASRNLLFLPVSIAVFWALPFWKDIPAWSLLSLTRLQWKAATTGVRIEELKTSLQYFPLNASLHQNLGLRLVQTPGERENAWKEFRIANRLKPSSWTYPVAQAMASQHYSPGVGLHFWSLAVERAGHRDEELFITAFQNTSSVPGATSFWASYAETNPRFLLTYALCLNDPRGKEYFEKWWRARADASDLERFEITNFYRMVGEAGAPGHLEQWIQWHPQAAKEDIRKWVDLLHRWEKDELAWQMISKLVPEPEYPASTKSPLEDMERIWLRDPENTVNAQSLATYWHQKGDISKAGGILNDVAQQKKAPEWFRIKAAYLKAGEGKFAEAVNLVLRKE